MGWFAFNHEKERILRSVTGRGFVVALYDAINGFLAVCSGSKPFHCIGFNILSDSITCNNSSQKDQEWTVNRRRLRTRRRRKDLSEGSHTKGLKKVMKDSCITGIIRALEQMDKKHWQSDDPNPAGPRSITEDKARAILHSSVERIAQGGVKYYQLPMWGGRYTSNGADRAKYGSQVLEHLGRELQKSLDKCYTSRYLRLAAPPMQVSAVLAKRKCNLE
jgi:hypothetical protein